MAWISRPPPSGPGPISKAAALARQVVAFGMRRGIEVPLSQGLAMMMAGELSAAQLGEALMARPARRE